MRACPVGWYLPTDAEWTRMTEAVGGVKQKFGKRNEGQTVEYYWKTAGKTLKSKTGWRWNNDYNISGNGTDNYGFSALPGGMGRSNGDFNDVGNIGNWWSASVGATWMNARILWTRAMYSNNDIVYRGASGGGNLLSVRCVRD